MFGISKVTKAPAIIYGIDYNYSVFELICQEWQ
jgi:hypothetical protein